MLLQSVFGVCLLLLGAINADENIEKANAYIDKFIAQATSESGGFIDPLPLEEVSTVLERTVVLVPVKGEAKLWGNIIGLSTLERVGDASVIDLDDMLMISCSMSFKEIKAVYRGALTLNNAGLKITVNAAIGSSNVSMVLTVPTAGGNATLISFKIMRLGDIDVRLEGFGLWGWAKSNVINLVLNTLKKPVAEYASAKVFDVFSEEIGKVPYSG